MRRPDLRILRPILASVIVAMALAGCNRFGRGSETLPDPTMISSPEDRLLRGIEAWRAEDYESAEFDLSRLATDRLVPEISGEARLLLTALQLDPRNEEREIASGAAIAAELLLDTTVSPGTRQVGEIIYLLAREIGAPPPEDTASLPSLPGKPLATLLDEMRGERDEQALEISELLETLEERDEEIEKLRRELERIRKTLRP